MRQILESYIENSNKNGLMLLTIPTGVGKTYHSFSYIADSIIRGDSKKYIFATGLKKNLDEEKLEEMFKERGEERLFKEKFIFLKPYYEDILENFQKVKVSSKIKDTAEYRELASLVGLIKQYKTGTNIFLDKLRGEVEPNFRKLIHQELKKEFPDTSVRKDKAKFSKEWGWVGELYPSVFLDEKSIIFLSIDKLLHPISTISEAPTSILDSPLFSNAILFIDEFDATKDIINNFHINNGLKNKVDIISLTNTILHSLNNKQFPKQMLKQSEKAKEKGYKDESLKYGLEECRKKFAEVSEKYNLAYSFKTEEGMNTNKSFIFHDYTSLEIVNNQKTKLAGELDEEENFVKIKLIENNKEAEINIKSLAGEVFGVIKYFAKVAKTLSLNHYQRQLEKGNVYIHSLTLEDSMKSILKEFNLKDDEISFLISIMNSFGNKKKKENKEEVIIDLSFCDNGFSFCAIEDKQTHDFHSQITSYSFSDTAEKTLVKLCQKMKVIGISATGTIKSVIGNYDLEYIEEKLGDTFHKLTLEEKERLQKFVLENNKYYEKVNIEVPIMKNVGSLVSEDISTFFDNNEKLACRIEEILTNNPINITKGDSMYAVNRHLKIAQSFYKFIHNQNVDSLLMLLNKKPVADDKNLNLTILEEIFDAIASEGNVCMNSKENLKLLAGEDFDTEKKKLLDELKGGKKICVISTYQTMGAGQNIQYPIPEKVKDNLVVINDLPPRKEKDFDAIYLEKPTNVVANLSIDIDETSLIKSIYQTEYMNGLDLSPKEADERIKQAFECYVSRTYRKRKSIAEKSSIKGAINKVLIQGIGRICRTNNKNKQILIMLDEDNLQCIEPSIKKEMLLNPEVNAVIGIAEENFNSYNQKEEEAKLNNIVSSVSSRAFNYINKFRGRWTKEKMAEWNSLRKYVLINPTVQDILDQHGYNKNLYINIYDGLDCTRYSYEEKGDYKEVKILANKKGNSKVVSSEQSKLDLFMKNKVLKQHFIDSGYATAFPKNPKIMCPVIFNNIYCGVLGEECGRVIFDKFIGINLEEITDINKFEMFDFKIANKNIYVDFKNWHDGTDFDNEEMLEHIAQKAIEIGTKKVIIANMSAEGEYYDQVYSRNGVEILIISDLLDCDDASIDDYTINTIRNFVEKETVENTRIPLEEPVQLAKSNEIIIEEQEPVVEPSEQKPEIKQKRRRLLSKLTSLISK